MATERRFSELRAGEGDIPEISGTVVRFGDVATMPGFRERFMPGAFGTIEGAVLNFGHVRANALARYPGGGLELRVSAESIEAVAHLPNTTMARDVVTLMRAGVIRGFSLEFKVPPGGDRFVDGDLREISRAQFRGLALVDDPAYGDSLAEVAARAAQIDTPPDRRRRRWI